MVVKRGNARECEQSVFSNGPFVANMGRDCCRRGRSVCHVETRGGGERIAEGDDRSISQRKKKKRGP